MQTEKNLADMKVIGRTKLESEIHDDDHDGDNESDKILAHHLVFSLLGFCPLGFVPTTMMMTKTKMTKVMDERLLLYLLHTSPTEKKAKKGSASQPRIDC